MTSINYSNTHIITIDVTDYRVTVSGSSCIYGKTNPYRANAIVNGKSVTAKAASIEKVLSDWERSARRYLLD